MSQEHDIKEKIMARISVEIDKRELSQRAAGKVLGISQSRVCAIKNGATSEFGIDRLLGYAKEMGADLRLEVRG